MTLRNKLIFLLSLAIAVIGSLLYVKARTAGTPVPYYVMGLLAYGSMFILFTIIDSAARSYKKRYRGK